MAVTVSADECTSYQTLNEEHRSTLAVPTGSDRFLCDRALPNNWYRFTNGDMPTSCVPTYHCGTQIPIWLNGQLPTVRGTTVTLKACFNYGQGVNPVDYGGTTCCHFSKQIEVKNCGSFNVYHLSRTQGCQMAYCAGNRPVCKIGQSNIGSANCSDLYPRMTSAPTLGKPVLVDAQGHIGSACSTHGRVKFPCHIPYPKGEPDVSFEVTWISNGSDPIMDPGTQTPLVTTLHGDDRDALLDERYMRGHMGTTLQCRVRSYHTSTPGVKSESLSSKEFWAGIVVHNNSITVDEKGQDQEITLESTVPITCNSPFQQQTCQIEVEMKASNDPTDISTTSCTYQLTCDPSTQTYKGSIKVTATRDFVKDGNQLHELAFRPISSPISHPMWDGYVLDPVQIRTIDRPHGICSTSGDPHVYQIDSSRNIAVNEIGDMILYKSLIRPFEVQIRTWGCGKYNPCICSVIVREGNDVVEVDMCAKRLNQIAAPHLSHWPLTGTTVDKDSTGKQFNINFPSGAHLRVQAQAYHPSKNTIVGYLTLNLQVPTDDLGNAIGLCGKYDNDKTNDLVGANGHIYSTSNKGEFVHTWLINPGSSMFDQKPAYSASAAINNTNYCQCDHHNADCTKAKASNPLSHQCGNSPCTNVGTQGVHPRHLDYPVETRSPRVIRQVHKRTITSFPTPSGMTEAMAVRSCTDAIHGSSLYSRCQSVLLSETVNYYIDGCVKDMMYADSDVFNVAHMNTFDFECQDTVLRNISNFAKDPKGERIPPADVTNHVCPNQCGRRGTCREGICMCQTGYTGDDCSVPVGVAPVASHIRGDGICDIRDRQCMKVQVIAQHLMDGPGLKCRYKKAELGEGKIIPYGSYVDAPALFTNFLEVECSLPASDVLTKQSPKEAFVVSVTRDGVLYSSDLTFIVYDGLCQNCGISGRCTLKDNTCLIDNLCHSAGEQDHQGGYCDPHTDSYSWTKNPVVSEINYYTSTGSGCQCGFDKTRFDCACCTNNGCQCGNTKPHICTSCSHLTSCTTYPDLIVGN